jgi:hypothetical protein
MSTDFQISLPMESNRRLDRISMYHSIEARSPFQDRIVVGAARKSMRNATTKYLTRNCSEMRSRNLENSELERTRQVS